VFRHTDVDILKEKKKLSKKEKNYLSELELNDAQASVYYFQETIDREEIMRE